MISKTKAVKAAATLQQYCKERKLNCYDCPFGTNCLFKYCPSGWQLTRIHLKISDTYEDEEGDQ